MEQNTLSKIDSLTVRVSTPRGPNPIEISTQCTTHVSIRIDIMGEWSPPAAAGLPWYMLVQESGLVGGHIGKLTGFAVGCRCEYKTDSHRVAHAGAQQQKGAARGRVASPLPQPGARVNRTDPLFLSLSLSTRGNACVRPRKKGREKRRLDVVEAGDVGLRRHSREQFVALDLLVLVGGEGGAHLELRNKKKKTMKNERFEKDKTDPILVLVFFDAGVRNTAALSSNSSMPKKLRGKTSLFGVGKREREETGDTRRAREFHGEVHLSWWLGRWSCASLCARARWRRVRGRASG